jgi:hypothetical protein
MARVGRSCQDKDAGLVRGRGLEVRQATRPPATLCERAVRAGLVGGGRVMRRSARAVRATRASPRAMKGAVPRGIELCVRGAVHGVVPDLHAALVGGVDLEVVAVGGVQAQQAVAAAAGSREKGRGSFD